MKVTSTEFGTQTLCSKGLVNKPVFLEHFLYIRSGIPNSLTVYTAHFPSGKLAFVEKKILSDCNNHTLVKRTGQVLLACFGCLAVSPGIAQICYQELGYPITNGNSVSMTV